MRRSSQLDHRQKHQEHGYRAGPVNGSAEWSPGYWRGGGGCVMREAAEVTIKAHGFIPLSSVIVALQWVVWMWSNVL